MLDGMAAWMRVHGEAIFGTRPWTVSGEGPTKSAGGMFNEGRAAYGPQDVRFTTKGDTLFAFLLGWPTDRRAVIASLASTSPHLSGRKVADVSLLGDTGRVEWTQDAQGLAVQLPATPPSEHAVALRVKGVV
jgi:alpha-L-fucosidase